MVCFACPVDPQRRLSPYTLTRKLPTGLGDQQRKLSASPLLEFLRKLLEFQECRQGALLTGTIQISSDGPFLEAVRSLFHDRYAAEPLGIVLWWPKLE